MATPHVAQTSLFVGLLLLSTLTTEAHAYLDAGTGSQMMQMSLAAVLSGLAFIRPIWRKVRGMFDRLRGSIDPGEGGGE